MNAELQDLIEHVTYIRDTQAADKDNEYVSPEQRERARGLTRIGQMLLDALNNLTDAEHVALKLANYDIPGLDWEFWKPIALRLGWDSAELDMFSKKG